MGFFAAVATGFRKYFTFSGRASRSEYWYFSLFIFLSALIVGAADGSLFGPGMMSGMGTTYDASGDATSGFFRSSEYGGGPMSNIWSLLTFLPSLSVCWRRLHDTDRPGWYCLIPVVVAVGAGLFVFSQMGLFSGMPSGPQEMMQRFRGLGSGVLLGAGLVFLLSVIMLLAWLCQASQRGANRFGPNPFGITR